MYLRLAARMVLLYTLFPDVKAAVRAFKAAQTSQLSHGLSLG